MVLTFGSFTTEIHEPCQVRNEAALSGTFRVLKGCLDRANCIGNVCGYQFEAGRTAFVIKMLLVAANLGMSGRFIMLACNKLYDIPKLSCESKDSAEGGNHVISGFIQKMASGQF